MSNDTKLQHDALPTELDARELAEVTGGKTYTGGRFQLDIGKYSVGYLKKYVQPQGEQETPPAVPPARA